MGRMDGKVVLVTGAARGQGRSHAVRMAEEGATGLVLWDICRQIPTVPYGMATSADLKETVRLTEALGSEVVADEVDVRKLDEVTQATQTAISQLGHIDVICANAGISVAGLTWEYTADEWTDVVDVNLNGVWNVLRAALPHMIHRNRGGSIIITSSTGGLRGIAHNSNYTAAKHGVVGLARTLASELADYGIRVNTVHPTGVATDMIFNEAHYKLFSPDKAAASRADMREPLQALNLLPVPWLEPRDVSNAVVFLASDLSRAITGAQVPVDAGNLAK